MNDFIPDRLKKTPDIWVALCFRNYQKCKKTGYISRAGYWINLALEFKKDLNPPFEIQYRKYKQQKNQEK